MKAIKKIMVAVLLSLSMVVSFMPTNVFAAEVPTFSGGNGTQEDPWLISSSNDLIELADWVNSEKAKTFDMDDCGTGYFHGYYFKQISLKDGLSQSTVNCVLSDHQGVIWIGTSFGLNRFDRERIMSYNNDKDNLFSIPGNDIIFFRPQRGLIKISRFPLCR